MDKVQRDLDRIHNRWLEPPDDPAEEQEAETKWAKITVTVELVYELVPENYPSDMTFEEMVDFDVELIGTEVDTLSYLKEHDAEVVSIEGKVIDLI